MTEPEGMVNDILEKAGHSMSDSDFFFVTSCQGRENELSSDELEFLTGLYDFLV